MSLSTQTNRTDHTENGVTTVFPFDFKIFSEADLVVISVDQNTLTETTLSLGTDYTISGVNAESGSITKTAGTSGDGLVIKRVVDLTQPTVLRNQSDFFPATHERAFDRSIMIDQQQQEEIDRCFRAPAGSSGVNLELPNATPGYALGWNATGDALVAVPNTGVDQAAQLALTDAAIRSDFAAADAAVADAAAADSSLVRSEFASADGMVTSAFQAADAALDTRLDAVETGQSSAVVGYDTQANLYANLVPIASSVAYVMNDPTPSKNGTYRKVGGTGTGSWVQSSYDRVALVETQAASTEVSWLGDGARNYSYLKKLSASDTVLRRTDWQGTWDLSSATRRIINKYSEPLLANFFQKSGTITQGALTDHGLSNGATYPAAAQLDYSYLQAGDTLLSATPYTATIFVKMADLSQPVVGSVTSGFDFSINIGGTYINPLNGFVYTNLGGGLWRVDAVGVTASVSTQVFGVVRSATNSGKGFTVTGFYLTAGSTVTPYIKNPGATYLDVADYSVAADGKVTTANTPEVGAVTEWVPTAWALASVTPRVTTLETTTAPPIAAVEVLGGGKNKFNPAIATDAEVRNYGSGTLGSYADGIDFGLQSVSEGKTYTLSQTYDPAFPSTSFDTYEVLYCFGPTGTYLGLSKPLLAYPVAPIPPTGVVWSSDHRQVTFTIPVGSGISKIGVMQTYSAHSTADFNRRVAGVQLEEGASKTAFELYGFTGQPTLKMAAIPAAMAGVAGLVGGTPRVNADSLPPAMASRNAGVHVIVAGGALYVRTAWTSTLDMVQKIVYSAGTPFTNDVVNLDAIRSIPAITLMDDTAIAWGVGASLAVAGDDSTPLQYNGTYIGANHGPYFVHGITAAGHGKTSVDVGSTWTGSGHTWTILRVVDANTLWVMSENTGTAALWNFITASISGVTLTHASGATHTTAIVVTADTLTQLWPSLQSQTKAIRLDGRYTVTVDGTYPCEFLDIINTYNIVNPAALLDYLHANIGTTTLNPPSVAANARVSVTYRYGSNGACSIYQRIQALQDLTLNYAGMIQAAPPTFSGETLLAYIPKVNPIVGGLKTWNFKALEDITTTIETIDCTTATWTSSTNPPDRFAQIVRVGATNQFGLVIGYSMQRGVGVPATRKDAVNNAFTLYSSRKMYPKAVTGSAYASNIMPAGTVLEGVCYRSIFDSTALPEATVFTWAYDGDDILLILDFHQTVSALKVPCPSWWGGKTATLIDSTGFTLHTSMVSEDGLLVSTSGGYGSAVIRVR